MAQEIRGDARAASPTCATRCSAAWGTGAGAIGLTGKALGMYGRGGIGKTVLAAALAQDDTVRRHFVDGVFWVTIGERGDLVGAHCKRR